MNKEMYERTRLTVTLFSSSDVIATSGEGDNPGGGGNTPVEPPTFNPGSYEVPIGF